MKKLWFVLLTMLFLVGCGGDEEPKIDLTPIAEVREVYALECEALRTKENGNVANFQDCRFVAFPEMQEFYHIVIEPRHLTVQEGWDIITNYVTQCGFADVTDFDNEIIDASGEFAIYSDVNQMEFAKVKPDFDRLSKGNGFYLDSEHCYIQLCPGGIYGCSDGRIARYVGEGTRPAYDSFGMHQEDIVEEYNREEWKDVTYSLMDGDYPINEAVNLAEAFFNKGTPLEVPKDVKAEVVRASVYRMPQDKYGYSFTVRRTFRGIPITYGMTGKHNFDWGEKMFTPDIKKAYMVDGAGICSFTGYNENSKFSTVGDAYTALIPISDAARRMEESLAEYLNFSVQEAELVYLTYTNSPEDEEKGIIQGELCWLFRGRCLNQDDGIDVYINATTGKMDYVLHAWE